MTLGITIGLCGCGEITGLPSAEPVPVIQGLLVLGESRHLLNVAGSSPAQEPYDPIRPIDPSMVNLWLLGPAGDSVRYEPTGLSGEFAAMATLHAGSRYGLSGTIAVRTVSAQVSVPGPLVIAEPAEDTLRLALAAGSPSLPFRWRAESAFNYQALLVDNDGTTRTALLIKAGDSGGRAFDIAPDTTGELVLFPPSSGQPDTIRLVIRGYDRTATAFFSSTPKGNVRGAFGLFGAAAKAEKVIVWE